MRTFSSPSRIRYDKVVKNQPFVNFTILFISQLLFRLLALLSAATGGGEETGTMHRNDCLNYERCSLNFLPSIISRFLVFVKSRLFIYGAKAFLFFVLISA